MDNKIFYCDSVLAEMEQAENWEKCIKYLDEKMASNPQDKRVLCRLAAQCWYVLTFWDCDMPKEKLNRLLYVE